MSRWVFCCGMRRSGSTLQFQIARRLIEDAGVGQGERWERPAAFPALRARLAGETDWRVFKSHAYTEPMGDELAAGHAVGVYAYRDLRDVMASAMRKWQHSFDELWEAGFLDQELRRMRLWTAHPAVLVSRYEELVADLPSEVARIAAHLGLTVDAATCRRIAEDHSMDRQRDRIARAEARGSLAHGLNDDTFDPDSLLHTNHIQSGRHGAWQDVLGRGQVACIETRYGPWLVQHGYRLRMSGRARRFWRGCFLLTPPRALRFAGYAWRRFTRGRPPAEPAP